MSEEVQEQEVQEPEAQEAEAPKEQQTEAAAESQPKEEAQAAGDAPSGAKKEKKINRLSADALDAKMKEMEEKKLTNSKYYKHLIQRKNEITAQ